MGRFVFLDRDGTLSRDHGYTWRVEDYELLPGVEAALRRLADAGFELAIVTNQSGIARGLFAEEDYQRFRDHVERDLAARGIRIARTYHCPHLPDAGCGCRKPAPGMLLRARDELGAELPASWVIGDMPTDVELAARAGCAGGILISSEPGPDAAPDLAAAVDLVLARAAS